MANPDRSELFRPPLQEGVPTLDDVSQSVRLGRIPELEAARQRGRERAGRELHYGRKLGDALSDVIEAESVFATIESPTLDDAALIANARLSFIVEVIRNTARPEGSEMNTLGREAIQAYAKSLIRDSGE